MQSWGTQSLGYYDLPGVFTENPIKNNVNVPLWSLVVEICAYIMIAALFCVGLLKKRLATILFALVILDSILPERILFPFLPKGNEDYSYLPFCFSIGALMAVYKEEFLVSAKIPIGFLLLLFIFSKTEYARYFFYLSLFTGIVYVFSCKPLLRIKLPVDVSYGVYLWGWPIQQVLASIFPSMGVLGNQVFGIILALIFGCFSWYLVEKRSIEYGRELIKCFSGNRLILDFYSKNK
jgi:peptidoglycan/LPS O-acetylase OafA/YrhL